MRSSTRDTATCTLILTSSTPRTLSTRANIRAVSNESAASSMLHIVRLHNNRWDEVYVGSRDLFSLPCFSYDLRT